MHWISYFIGLFIVVLVMSPIIYIGICKIRRSSTSLAGTPLVAAGLIIIALFASAPFLSKNTDTKQASTSNSAKIYSTKVTKISETKDHYWLIEGTSKAPNNAKVMLTATDKDNFNYGNQEGESISGGSFAKVKDGKFKVIADPIDINNANTAKSGQSTSVVTFATKKFKGNWADLNLPKNWKNKNLKSIKLIMTQSQADYMNDDKTEDSSSSSESSTSTTSTSSSESKKTGINGEISDMLAQSQGFATGDLDENGNETNSGTPNDTFAWSLLVNKVKYSGGNLEIYVNTEFESASNAEKNTTMKKTQNMALSVIEEHKDLSDDTYANGLFATVYSGNNAIGHTRLTDYDKYKWY